MHDLPATGYLRLHDIIGRPATKGRPAIPAIIPVCSSTFWHGVRTGRYPQPTRALGQRITAWRVEDIRRLRAQSRGPMLPPCESTNWSEWFSPSIDAPTHYNEEP